MTRTATLDYAAYPIKMLVTTNIEEKYRIHACAKEPWTVQWLETIPTTGILWDVGANVGSYSLIAAARGIQVVAIDPSFANHARLCENIILNSLQGKIVPVCAALAHVDGYALMEQEPSPGHSGGSKRVQTLVLTMRTLMQILPPPTHVKIDVDGAEDQVLLGLLQQQPVVRPNLFVEHSVKKPGHAEQILAEAGYALKARNEKREGEFNFRGIWMGEWVHVPAPSTNALD